MNMVISVLIDLNELNTKNEIKFKYKVLKDDELDKRIKKIENAYVEGRVYINLEDNVTLECIFNGIMYIIDSISLDEVPYEFSISIEENLDEISENYENSYDNRQNTLDLKRVLWQNIVLEVPISYTRVNDANFKGDGWELVREDKLVEEIDPRLKKLEELLERRD